MNVTWILDSDSFSDYHDKLVTAIHSQGHVVKTLPLFFSSYEWGDTSRFYDELSPKESCVVCHASFEFTDLIAEDELWTPGTYGICSTTDFSYYATQLSNHLLNSDYELIPFSELLTKAESLFNSFGNNEQIFIRPDSGHKPFTGRLFSRTEIDERGLSASRMSPKSLVVVARPKEICREWRFIVVDGYVVASSMYKEFDKVRISSDVKTTARDFASKVAMGDFQPDRVWVLDTCETNQGEMFVLEVNGFSSANWYACEPEPVVASVSRVALEDWHRTVETT